MSEVPSERGENTHRRKRSEGTGTDEDQESNDNNQQKKRSRGTAAVEKQERDDNTPQSKTTKGKAKEKKQEKDNKTQEKKKSKGTGTEEKNVLAKDIIPDKSEGKKTIEAFYRILEKEAAAKHEERIEKIKTHTSYSRAKREKKETSRDNKNISTRKRSEEKLAHNRSNLEYQKRKKYQSGHKLVMEEKTFDYGTYLEMTAIPYHIMAGLIQNFRTPEFDMQYDNHASNITAGNKGVTSYNKSKYWFLDCKASAGDPALEYQDNSLLNKLQIQLLDQLKRLMIMGVKEALKDKNLDYTFYRPGFVRTGEVRHHVLHLDSTMINFEEPYDALIVHFPLEKDGQWLRLGNIKETKDGLKLIQKLIHIPFGTGVILPATQLHAGHYGKKKDMRFHAVISRTEWKKSNLWLIDEYVRTKIDAAGGYIYEEFYEYQISVDPVVEMEDAKNSRLCQIATNYHKTLSQMYDYPIFHLCMRPYAEKYTNDTKKVTIESPKNDSRMVTRASLKKNEK